ncbi:MAG TPA: hypothetical protein VFS36_16250 [Chitinophagaceae bacterium]|jgi:hypothetical protein|nr:hypothetical protein [Chitinophagaceae bacterium]
MNIESVVLKFLAAETQLQVLPKKLEEARKSWLQLLDSTCPGGQCSVTKLQVIYNSHAEVEKYTSAIDEKKKELKENTEKLAKILQSLNGKKLSYVYVSQTQQSRLQYEFWLEGNEVKHNFQRGEE